MLSIRYEFSGIDFGDKRLNARFLYICDCFEKRPNSTIHGCFTSAREMKAAYRWLSNEKVNAEFILLYHRARVLERTKEHDIILHIQDTTEMNFNQRKQIEGMGRLRTDKDQGFFMHTTIAVTPERVTLGVVQNKIYIRNTIMTHEERKEAIKRPIEDKESMRWLESFRYTNETAKIFPEKLLINVGDREGDFFELFEEAQKAHEGIASFRGKAHILVRAKRNRNINLDEENASEIPKKRGRKNKEEKSEMPLEFLVENSNITDEFMNLQALSDDISASEDSKKLVKFLKKQPVLTNMKFDIVSKGIKKRTVFQSVRIANIKLDPPPHLKGHKKVSLVAILCTEDHPPKGQKPIEWMFLTTLPVSQNGGKDSIKPETVIQFYLCRWNIELIFKILKSCCDVEGFQFESIDKYLICISIYFILATRLLMIIHKSREKPNLLCTTLFSREEWRMAYIMADKKLTRMTPTLRDITHIIAALGGFKKTKKYPEPGFLTLFRGFHFLLSGICLAQKINKS